MLFLPHHGLLGLLEEDRSTLNTTPDPEEETAHHATRPSASYQPKIHFALFFPSIKLSLMGRRGAQLPVQAEAPKSRQHESLQGVQAGSSKGLTQQGITVFASLFQFLLPERDRDVPGEPENQVSAPGADVVMGPPCSSWMQAPQLSSTQGANQQAFSCFRHLHGFSVASSRS